MDKYLIDSHKLHYHPEWVARWLKAETWDEARKVYPIYWEITTSAACNHRCTFCSVDAIGYPAILMDEEILVERMHEARNLGVKSVMFAGTGEPLLHKHINSILHGATVTCDLDAAFTTNGFLLDKLDYPQLCRWIKVSLNAGSKENYARIHQTKESDWDKVWENIESTAKKKGKCALGIQCVVLPENYKEMKVLIGLAYAHGADYVVLKPYSQGTFSIVQRLDIDYDDMRGELESLESMSRAGFDVICRSDAMKQESEDHHYDRCRATPMAWVYSMANGDVFSCSAHLLDDRFKIGNLNYQTFQEIWEGEGRRKNWEMMKKFDINQCRLNCRMDKPNRYLHALSNGIEHQNYI